MKTLPGTDEIKKFVTEHDSFTLIAHVSPDGDTLGSSLALFSLLRSMGKTVEVVCADKAPKVYLSFLPYINEIKLPCEAFGYPCVISVDCADLMRTGKAAELFLKAQHTLNIDHHPTNEMYANINCVDDTAAAVGELILCLFEQLPCAKIDIDAATCLYTAIMTDTGNFAYSNTSAETFAAASKLKALGVDTYSINRNVYRRIPYSKLKLTGLAICKMRLLFDGRFGCASLTSSDMKSVAASHEDTEGIIDNIRDVESVELAALIHEHTENTYRVSLRSKTKVNVGSMAQRLGGGGHERAAGYTAYGELAQIEALLLDMAENELNG